MKNYEIIVDKSPYELKLKINEFISFWYLPIGSVVYLEKYNEYFQAVYKKEVSTWVFIWEMLKLFIVIYILFKL